MPASGTRAARRFRRRNTPVGQPRRRHGRGFSGRDFRRGLSPATIGWSFRRRPFRWPPASVASPGPARVKRRRWRCPCSSAPSPSPPGARLSWSTSYVGW